MGDSICCMQYYVVVCIINYSILLIFTEMRNEYKTANSLHSVSTFYIIEYLTWSAKYTQLAEYKQVFVPCTLFLFIDIFFVFYNLSLHVNIKE